MKIYIASSWKNIHSVHMLTFLLRQEGHEVLSFAEFETAWKDVTPYEEWIKTEGANQCFTYDTTSAMTADLVVYISPSGKDAAAEVGMAFAKNIPIIGLYAKGEDFGLMRKMFTAWYNDYNEVIKALQEYNDFIKKTPYV